MSAPTDDVEITVDLDVLEITVEAADVGVPGPMGQTGPAGSHFVHQQADPSTVWTVTHNLGYDPPAIRVHDENGDDLGAVIVHYYDPGVALRAVFDQQTTGTLRAG